MEKQEARDDHRNNLLDRIKKRFRDMSTQRTDFNKSQKKKKDAERQESQRSTKKRIGQLKVQSNDHFNCNICDERYDEHDQRPMIVGCGHTFCNKCIGKLVNCPNCRKPLEHAICNFVLKDMVTTNKELEKCCHDESLQEFELEKAAFAAKSLAETGRWSRSPSPSQFEDRGREGSVVRLRPAHDTREGESMEIDLRLMYRELSPYYPEQTMEYEAEENALEEALRFYKQPTGSSALPDTRRGVSMPLQLRIVIPRHVDGDIDQDVLEAGIIAEAVSVHLTTRSLDEDLYYREFMRLRHLGLLPGT